MEKKSILFLCELHLTTEYNTSINKLGESETLLRGAAMSSNRYRKVLSISFTHKMQHEIMMSRTEKKKRDIYSNLNTKMSSIE